MCGEPGVVQPATVAHGTLGYNIPEFFRVKHEVEINFKKWFKRVD